MNATIEFRNVLAPCIMTKDYDRALSAEGDILIWRKGNQYAVTLNMERRIPEKDYTDQAAEEFFIHVYRTAAKIEKNWKLVELTEERTGKVIGQRQLTFYPENEDSASMSRV